MKLAYLALTAILFWSPAGAGEFASAPLNKTSSQICNHGVCSTFALISVMPLSNKRLANGWMYSVVYKSVVFDDGSASPRNGSTTSLVNDVVFCYKSGPALFSYNPETGWTLSYLHPGNADRQGQEEWSWDFYMAVCHSDLKFDARDPIKMAHKLGYEFSANDPIRDDDLLETAVSPYAFIANDAKPYVAKPDGTFTGPAPTPPPDGPAARD